MIGPLEQEQRNQQQHQQQSPLRILEVGPGTGAITRRLVRLLRPEDRFDLVEINETFAAMLTHSFETDSDYRRVAEQSQLHVCPLQEFQSDVEYDFIISSLPLNNFSAELVREIFDAYVRLLSPDGILSYFEYMFMRPMRCKIGREKSRKQICGTNLVIAPYLRDHRIQRNWVFANVPPAWVQHLRVADIVATQEQKSRRNGQKSASLHVAAQKN